MRKKPIVTKIEFTKEQQADIDAIKQGRPVKAVVDKLVSKGWNIEKYTVSRTKQSSQNMHAKLKKEYYHGICKCGAWPVYKVIKDVGGATLREWYCEKHLPKF